MSELKYNSYRNTSLGCDKWKELIGSQGSLQYDCNKEGFDVVCSHIQTSKARIGIVSNNENKCDSCDSRIGFGTGGYPNNSNTCGNEAVFKKKMETVTSKPWDTSWYNKNDLYFAKNLISLISNIQFYQFQVQPSG